MATSGEVIRHSISPPAEPCGAPMNIVQVNINTEEPSRQNEVSGENENKFSSRNEYSDDNAYDDNDYEEPEE